MLLGSSVPNRPDDHERAVIIRRIRPDQTGRLQGVSKSDMAYHSCNNMFERFEVNAMPRRCNLLLISVAIFSCFSYIAIAGEVTYYYDDIGRLTRVANGADAASYQYDEVGNLLSITTGTINLLPPVLSNINPCVIFPASTMQFIITGQNLLTTETITTDNPLITVRTLSVTDTAINLSIDAPSAGQSGGVNLTVATLYGSANIGITFVSLSLSSQYLALSPGSAGSMTASISPIVGKDTSITVSSSNPKVASMPSIIVIPPSGSVTFNVNALQEGIAALTFEGLNSPKMAIFVSQPFALLPGESSTATAKPVSVYLMPSAVLNVTPVSLPVSIYIEQSAAVNATSVSQPFSVQISPP